MRFPDNRVASTKLKSDSKKHNNSKNAVEGVTKLFMFVKIIILLAIPLKKPQQTK